MTHIPKYASLSTLVETNYLVNLRDDKNYNVKFIRDRKIVVLRNADEKGVLIDLRKSVASLPDKPWVMLSVRQFQINGVEVPVPICHHCCDSLDSISTNQSFETISKLLCIHGKVSANIIRDFETAIALDGWLCVFIKKSTQF